MGIGLCADELLLLTSSEQGVQHALDRFSAVCSQVGMKISSEASEVLLVCLSRNVSCVCCKPQYIYCSRWRCFKYLGVVFKSDKRRYKEVDTPIGKILIQFIFLFCALSFSLNCLPLHSLNASKGFHLEQVSIPIFELHGLGSYVFATYRLSYFFDTKSFIVFAISLPQFFTKSLQIFEKLSRLVVILKSHSPCPDNRRSNSNFV